MSHILILLVIILPWSAYGMPTPSGRSSHHGSHQSRPGGNENSINSVTSHRNHGSQSYGPLRESNRAGGNTYRSAASNIDPSVATSHGRASVGGSYVSANNFGGPCSSLSPAGGGYRENSAFSQPGGGKAFSQLGGGGSESCYNSGIGGSSMGGSRRFTERPGWSQNKKDDQLVLAALNREVDELGKAFKSLKALQISRDILGEGMAQAVKAVQKGINHYVEFPDIQLPEDYYLEGNKYAFDIYGPGNKHFRQERVVVKTPDGDAERIKAFHFYQEYDYEDQNGNPLKAVTSRIRIGRIPGVNVPDNNLSVSVSRGVQGADGARSSGSRGYDGSYYGEGGSQQSRGIERSRSFGPGGSRGLERSMQNLLIAPIASQQNSGQHNMLITPMASGGGFSRAAGPRSPGGGNSFGGNMVSAGSRQSSMRSAGGNQQSSMRSAGGQSSGRRTSNRHSGSNGSRTNSPSPMKSSGRSSSMPPLLPVPGGFGSAKSGSKR